MARLMGRCALLLCALLAVQSHETRVIQGNDACKSWCQEDGEKTWQVKCGFKGCKECDECAESESSRQVIVDSVNQALYGLALPGCDSYKIMKLQKAGAHEEQLTCPHGFEPLDEGSIPNHFQVSGCGSEGFLAVTVAQVQCKCTSGCQCEHEGKANIRFVGKFWSKAAPDGMKATQEVYKAYAQERGKAAQRLDLPENCFQTKKRRNSLGASMRAAGESTSWPPPLNADWEAPEQHVDALTSPAKEKLLMLLETELNKIKMPKQVLEPCYGGTAQLDYGGKATLGLLDYYDQYTVGSQKFHSRTKKRSENRLNCCSRACSWKTGYPAMWDKSACTPPELVRNAKTRRRATIYTNRPSCPLPEEMPKDAHLLRLAPCFVENYPICILIKLTQLDANTTLNEQTPLVLGWSSIQGLDLPGMKNDLKKKKWRAVTKREIHKRRRKRIKAARAAAEEAEGQVERLESFISFVQKADMIVREAVADLRFELLSDLQSMRTARA